MNLPKPGAGSKPLAILYGLAAAVALMPPVVMLGFAVLSWGSRSARWAAEDVFAEVLPLFLGFLFAPVMLPSWLLLGIGLLFAGLARCLSRDAGACPRVRAAVEVTSGLLGCLGILIGAALLHSAYSDLSQDPTPLAGVGLFPLSGGALLLAFAVTSARLVTRAQRAR